VAEDTVRNCKRGHPRIPENIYVRPSDGARQCRACRKIRKAKHDAIYRNTPKGRASRQKAQAQYEATTKGWATGRKFQLKGERERTQAELAALEREEAQLHARYRGNLGR
jgi:hypothetical protein